MQRKAGSTSCLEHCKSDYQITQDKDPEEEVTLLGTCGLQYRCWVGVSRLECGEPLESA